MRTVTRHEAVEAHIRQRVRALSPGDPIESDAELCRLFSVSRMTVRQATQRLAAEGVIYRVAGVGTFVGRPEVHRQMGELRSFTNEMASRGQAVRSKTLTATVRAGTKEENAAFRLPPESTVVELRRLRLVEDKPMAIERAVLPSTFAWLLSVDLEAESLHAALTDNGHRPAYAAGTQVAAAATAEDAALLDLEPGAPLFVEQRLVSDDSGAPIEATESRYAGSRFVFHIELRDSQPPV